MVGELKHYPGEELPWALWVNNEYIGSYKTMQEAASKYDSMMKEHREAVNV